MDITIRPYRESDRAACRALWVELTQHHREIYNSPGIGGPDPGSGFDRYMENADLQGPWVAVKADTIVGLVGLLAHGDEAEVEPVIVARQARGQGVGRALVDHVKEEATGRGFRFLNVRPVARNAKAIAFFVAAGFDVVGHIDLFQELAPSKEGQWRDGINVHGLALRF